MPRIPKPRQGLVLGGLLFVLALGGWFGARYFSKPPTPTRKVRVASEWTAGIRVDTLRVDSITLREGDLLGTLFADLGLEYRLVEWLGQQPDSLFNPRQLQVGRSFLILKDTVHGKVQFWMYPKDRVQTVVLDLRDSLPRLHLHRKPVLTRVRNLRGIIQSSLFQSVTDAGGSQELAMALAGTFDWTVDFFQIQKGDRYRMLVQEQVVDQLPYGSPRILAAELETNRQTFSAIRWKEGYYDLKGQSMKRRYLKAPLDFTRISSQFSTRRMHPVLRYLKPHLGVDYAAPKGTPVRTVGDGQVLEAGYRGGNGNYVKVSHSREHATGYLHLSRLAAGIRRGVKVRQGQVIGYVGSTGLSTGPHLCFRFWNRGVQVNPRKLQAPQSEPMRASDLPAFALFRDSLMGQLPSW